MSDVPPLFDELQSLITEQRNPNSLNIDDASVEEILSIINIEDQRVPLAVKDEIPYIAKAVNIVTATLKTGGRLFYVGAGTSGRLGILDASECPPTFGSSPEDIQGIIAGGKEAVFRAQEGAEDVASDGADALVAAGVRPTDVVCGIAASRRTPFVVGAISQAKKIGCQTLFITCNPRSNFNISDVDVAICVVVGPEVIMGSTRMKSGTAQKLVLNMITTASMIRLGKVYQNMMVDLQMTAEKLTQRSRRTVMTVTGLSYQDATTVLAAADGHVKTALVMVLAEVSKNEALARLEKSDGFVRGALKI
ncbi:MAG: N-acetylmuramic acid 6-phosphate etherase [Bacteroidetes bacterium]|nr:N-acetylmuramic acid 6-phosphate etherase [Bacteroidota bacterium]